MPVQESDVNGSPHLKARGGTYATFPAFARSRFVPLRRPRAERPFGG